MEPVRGGGHRTAHHDIYSKICTIENLERAFSKAKKRKSHKPYVQEFEERLSDNLQQLHHELATQTYLPRPLRTFIISDPKTRKISKSAFRDRVIHHAICNIIEPIFDKTFIHDSYANRRGKGTLKAIQRFNHFKRKVTKNFTRMCYVLKADVQHYFDTVDHQVLLTILVERISCRRTISLIKIILSNHQTHVLGKGMPLGNLTSQFFANVYLNELDQYVKHILKAKCYVRYVDDFIIFHHNPTVLKDYKEKINTFLREKLALRLHPDKSRIRTLNRGIGFLGFRIFKHYMLVRKKNLNRFHRRFSQFKHDYETHSVDRETIITSFEGWIAYIKHANTYKYRRHLIRQLNHYFPTQPNESLKIKKHARIAKAIADSKTEFTIQKTRHFFTQHHTIQQIAQKRSIKEVTVWNHLAKLIEYNQLSLWNVLPREKIQRILPHISSPRNTLKTIKARIKNDKSTYDEINCVLAYYKAKHKKRNICQLIHWYQKTHCYRKCYHNTVQRKSCHVKLTRLAAANPDLEFTRQEFLHLFNNHITICILPEQEKRRYITYKEFKQIRQKRVLPLGH